MRVGGESPSGKAGEASGVWVRFLVTLPEAVWVVNGTVVECQRECSTSEVVGYIIENVW